MNKTVLKIGGGCVLAALVLAGVVSMGQSCGKNKVAVLNLDLVQEKAVAYEKVKVETQKHISALKARFSDEEKALQTKAATLKKKIEENGNKVAGFEKELQKLQQELGEFQRKVRIQSALIAKARAAAINQVSPIAEELLKEISQKKGIEVILPRPYVTYVTPAADITDEFIKLLDDKDIQVSYPDPAQFTVPVVTADAVAEKDNQNKNTDGK